MQNKNRVAMLPAASAPTGILLVNLGTPQAPNMLAVAKYLREFLIDPRVITLPAILRWLLVNLVILPLRTYKITQAYKSIWTKAGSPLLVNSEQYCLRLAAQLGSNYRVVLAMRYGEPSIKNAIAKLLACNCKKVILLPMFPQYATATTGSAIAEVLTILAKQRDPLPVEVKPQFFAEPGYISALAATIAQELQISSAEFLLLSYHGLPEQQNNYRQNNYENNGRNISNSSSTSSSNGNSHNSNVKSKKLSYSEQCYCTAELLAAKLGLNYQQYGVSFQSRLGALPWIKPYTDKYLVTLRQRGIRNIAVACPSFVADCLETLEEIGLRLKQQWQQLGGENLQLIPCLNDHDFWVNAVVDMVTT